MAVAARLEILADRCDLAETLGQHPQEFSAQLVEVLTHVACALGRDVSEADRWRLLDALLLIAAHLYPAGEVIVADLPRQDPSKSDVDVANEPESTESAH